MYSSNKDKKMVKVDLPIVQNMWQKALCCIHTYNERVNEKKDN